MWVFWLDAGRSTSSKVYMSRGAGMFPLILTVLHRDYDRVY